MPFACIIALSLLAFASLIGPSHAADIKVLSTRAVMTILETVGPAQANARKPH